MCAKETPSLSLSRTKVKIGRCSFPRSASASRSSRPGRRSVFNHRHIFPPGINPIMIPLRDAASREISAIYLKRDYRRPRDSNRLAHLRGFTGSGRYLTRARALLLLLRAPTRCNIAVIFYRGFGASEFRARFLCARICFVHARPT